MWTHSHQSIWNDSMIAWIRIHGVLCIRFSTLFFLAPFDCLCAVYVHFHHVLRILLWVCANKLFRMLRSMAEPVFFLLNLFFVSVSFLVSSLSYFVFFAIYYSHEFHTNEDITFHFSWNVTVPCAVQPYIPQCIIYYLCTVRRASLATMCWWFFYLNTIFCVHILFLKQKISLKKNTLYQQNN